MRDFCKGQRVELHPATDSWMRGDRFGTVEKLGRKFIYVRMDASNRLRKTAPRNIGRTLTSCGSTCPVRK